MVTKNRKVYDVCQKRIFEGLGKDIPTLHKEVLKAADESKRLRDLDKSNSVNKVIKLDNNVFENPHMIRDPH